MKNGLIGILVTCLIAILVGTFCVIHSVDEGDVGQSYLVLGIAIFGVILVMAILFWTIMDIVELEDEYKKE